MTTTLPQQPQQHPAPCPAWCTGRHAQLPGEGPVLVGDARRYDHLAASCPAWCAGHPGSENPAIEGLHSGQYEELPLSLGEPYEMAGGELAADHVAVSCWRDPRHPVATVSLMHAASGDYLPDMLAAEAVAVAVALLYAAGQIEPGAAQLVTLGQVLADAVARREPSGFCTDCEVHPASLCEPHAADLDRCDAYLALAAELGIEVDR